MKKLRLLMATMATTMLGTVMMPVLAHAAASTVIVKGNTVTSPAENGSEGWWFNRDSTAQYEFNTSASSIGLGSLYVKPISPTPAVKFVAEDFIFKSIADVKSVTYDFQIAGNGTSASAGQFYMNVYANFGGSSPTKYYDCRYNVVPTIGSTSSFTTVSFDPTLSYPVDTRTGASASPHACPASPSGMQALSATGTATIRAFALNVGDSGASDAGLGGYLDKVVVTTNSDTTTYDFEPTISVADKDGCKNGGWMVSNTPTYKNQGECVSSFASSKAKGNPIANLVRSIF